MSRPCEGSWKEQERCLADIAHAELALGGIPEGTVALVSARGMRPWPTVTAVGQDGNALRTYVFVHGGLLVAVEGAGSARVHGTIVPLADLSPPPSCTVQRAARLANLAGKDLPADRVVVSPPVEGAWTVSLLADPREAPLAQLRVDTGSCSVEPVEPIGPLGPGPFLYQRPTLRREGHPAPQASGTPLPPCKQEEPSSGNRSDQLQCILSLAPQDLAADGLLEGVTGLTWLSFSLPGVGPTFHVGAVGDGPDGPVLRARIGYSEAAHPWASAEATDGPVYAEVIPLDSLPPVPACSPAHAARVVRAAQAEALQGTLLVQEDPAGHRVSWVHGPPSTPLVRGQWTVDAACVAHPVERPEPVDPERLRYSLGP